MFERFTDRARKAMALANQETQRFNHRYIGSEHILLGLIKEGGGVAAKALNSLGADTRRIRMEVEKLVKSRPNLVTMGKLPLSPQGEKVIQYAIDEARNMNHDYIGTEHLLLGLLREDDGVAAQVLANLGLNLEMVRARILELVGRGSERALDGIRPTVGGIELMIRTRLRLSMPFRRVVERAVAEAEALESEYLGPEHLLLALLREPDGVSAHVREKLGLNFEQVRETVLNFRGPPPQAGETGSGPI